MALLLEQMSLDALDAAATAVGIVVIAQNGIRDVHPCFLKANSNVQTSNRLLSLYAHSGEWWYFSYE